MKRGAASLLWWAAASLIGAALVEGNAIFGLAAALAGGVVLGAFLMWEGQG